MEGYIAEIRMFAGNFAPKNWAYCQSQLLSIAQNTALFSLLGTTYGGNGQTTFGLPDFRGRVPVGYGQGPGLPNIVLGELSGTPSVTLLTNNMPAHFHGVTGTVTQQVNNDTAGLTDDASGKRLGATGNVFTAATGDLVDMAAPLMNLVVGVNGSNAPFSNISPYLGMNYIICLYGIFPSRN